jgi:phi13 family phage major tail protein
MPNSVKANRFNVKRIVYSIISKDDKTAYNYGPIKALGEPMTVQWAPTLATGELYGGGVKTEDVAKLTGGALQVDVNKVYVEARAEILGNQYENGVLTENKNDQAKEIAVGYELEETGDNSEVVWLYKCKARPFGQNAQQTTNNMTFSTDTITFGAMPREFDGDIRAFGDTANSSFSKASAAAFLNTIPGGILVTGA